MNTPRILVTAGAIIRDTQNRILLQRRSDYGDWGLPGGGMEPGETIEQTMLREIREETGLELRFFALEEIELEWINAVQKPVFADLIQQRTGLLRR